MRQLAQGNPWRTGRPQGLEGETDAESPPESIVAERFRVDMSSSEAQTRYLAALAARQFSDEQMQLLSNSNIHQGQGPAELHQVLAKLSPEGGARLLRSLEAHPAAFAMDALAGMRSIRKVDPVNERPIRLDEGQGQ